MIRKLTKLKLTPVLASILFLFTILSPLYISAAEDNVISIEDSHDVVWLGAEVDVSVTFENDDNIQEVHIHYCWIDPIFRCRPTVEMDKKSGNTWKGTFEVIDVEGTIGYYLDIRYNNGGIKFIPDDFGYLNKSNIQEVAPSFFYITIPITDNPPENIGGSFTDHLARNLTLSIGLPTITISGVIIAIILYKRKH